MKVYIELNNECLVFATKDETAFVKRYSGEATGTRVEFVNRILARYPNFVYCGFAFTTQQQLLTEYGVVPFNGEIPERKPAIWDD